MISEPDDYRFENRARLGANTKPVSMLLFALAPINIAEPVLFWFRFTKLVFDLLSTSLSYSSSL